jgi:hypothetical protein
VRLSTVRLGTELHGAVRLGVAQLGTASFHIAGLRFSTAATSDRSSAFMPAATRRAGAGLQRRLAGGGSGSVVRMDTGIFDSLE